MSASTTYYRRRQVPLLDSDVLWESIDGSHRNSARASFGLAERYPERVLLVTFDDLVGHTGETIKRILGWLDLHPEPVCLEPTFNNMSVYSNSAFTPVTGIDNTPLHRRATDPIPADALDLYRRAGGVV